MKTDLERIEAAVAALAPNRVPERLEMRVFEIFDSEPMVGGTVHIARFPALRALGVAAAVAVAAAGVFFAVLNNLPQKQGGSSGDVARESAPRRTFVPVRAENVFEGASNEGFTLTSHNQPVQKLRYRFSDTYRWVNPQDGSTIEMVVPRERLLLVPARTD